MYSVIVTSLECKGIGSHYSPGCWYPCEDFVTAHPAKIQFPSEYFAICAPGKDFEAHLANFELNFLLQECRIYGYLFNMDMNGRLCDLKSSYHKIFITLNFQ